MVAHCTAMSFGLSGQKCPLAPLVKNTVNQQRAAALHATVALLQSLSSPRWLHCTAMPLDYQAENGHHRGGTLYGHVLWTVGRKCLLAPLEKIP